MHSQRRIATGKERSEGSIPVLLPVDSTNYGRSNSVQSLT